MSGAHGDLSDCAQISSRWFGERLGHDNSSIESIFVGGSWVSLHGMADVIGQGQARMYLID